METTQETSVVKSAENQIELSDNSSFSDFMDTNRFKQIQRAAGVFANSDMVPRQFQGNIANCIIALQMSMRMGIDPFMFMQSTYIIHGKPGLEAKLIIALINKSGIFTGPIQWKTQGEGDNRSCTAYATHKETGEVCEATVNWKMVVAEGWAGKPGSKWKSMPDQMFKYRSATFLGRLYCPEVLMGMKTQDELLDVGSDINQVPDTIPEPLNCKSSFRGKPEEPKQPEKAEEPVQEDPEEQIDDAKVTEKVEEPEDDDKDVGKLTIVPIRSFIKSKNTPLTYQTMFDHFKDEGYETKNLSRTLKSNVDNGKLGFFEAVGKEFYCLPERVKEFQSLMEPQQKPVEEPVKDPIGIKEPTPEEIKEHNDSIPVNEEPKKSMRSSDVLQEIIEMNPNGLNADNISVIANDYGLYLPITNIEGILDGMVISERIRSVRDPQNPGGIVFIPAKINN